MKRLLPYFVALAVFVFARQWRPGTPPAALPETPSQAHAAPRTELRGLARRAERLAGQEVGGVADLMRLSRSGGMAASELGQLVLRAAKLDPEGTWDWINGPDVSPNRRSSYRQMVAGIWFVREPEAVLSRLAATNSDDWQIAGSLVGFLFSKDPAESAVARKHLDALVALASPSPTSFFLPRDEGNAALLLALPEGRARDALTRQYATSWVEEDIVAARAWMKGLPDATQVEIMESFVERGGIQYNTSPEIRAAAAAWVQQEADPAARARLGPALVEWMAKEDPSAALAWASENLSAAPLAVATGKVVSQLFASNPDQAREIVAGLPPGNLRHRAAADVALAWSGKEPAAAIDWWLSQVDPAEAARSSGLSTAGRLGENWFRADPDTLRARLADPALPPLLGSLAQPALRQWAENEPAANLDWAASLPDDRRESVVGTLYREWAYEDAPAAGAAFVSRQDTAPPASAGPIASVWYRTDPEGSVRWTAALPPGPAREAALKNLKRDADFEVQLGGTFPPALQKLLD